MLNKAQYTVLIAVSFFAFNLAMGAMSYAPKTIRVGTPVLIVGGRFDGCEGIIMENTTHEHSCACGSCRLLVKVTLSDGSTKRVYISSDSLLVKLP